MKTQGLSFADPSRHPRRRAVLVTGGCGYLGSVLTEELGRRGADVLVVDSELVASVRLEAPNVTYIRGDVREPREWEQVLSRVDSVVHLASIVGDPACGVDPGLAWETNYLGTVRLAESCRRLGVRRLVFASTCSAYGRVEHEAEERSPLNPQSVYAETKIRAEHHLLASADDGISPVILRFATLHGLSHRMRFDLAVNMMTARAATEGVVVVHGGSQWRPFLHVRDAAQAIWRALFVAGGPRIYNCGSRAENYRLDQVGAMIARELPGVRVVIQPHAGDTRDYRVGFDAIGADLGFVPRHRIVDSVRSIRDAMAAGLFADYTAAPYSNYLIAQRHADRAPRALGSAVHAGAPA